VYARASFEDIYGKGAERFEQNLGKLDKPAFFRFWSTLETPGLGPLDEPLLSRTEVSYGSGLAMLSRYQSYLTAMESNPALLGDLAITHGIDVQRGTIVQNPAPLPRVTAPPEVSFARDRNAAHEALSHLDPASTVVIEAPPRALSPKGASLQITNYEGSSYVVQTDAPGEFALKLAVPFHPGWKASVDGSPVEVFPADEALQAVFVPAGRHQVKFWFEPPGFYAAVLISAAGLLICGLLLGWPSVFSPLFR
jgi:hypothetical protein